MPFGQEISVPVPVHFCNYTYILKQIFCYHHFEFWFGPTLDQTPDPGPAEILESLQIFNCETKKY
jgi:hypothetical protein